MATYMFWISLEISWETQGLTIAVEIFEEEDQCQVPELNLFSPKSPALDPLSTRGGCAHGSWLCHPDRQSQALPVLVPLVWSYRAMEFQPVWVGIGFIDHCFPAHGRFRRLSPWHQKHNQKPKPEAICK